MHGPFIVCKRQVVSASYASRFSSIQSDGTLGILSEVDVLFALGRQQRDAQAVGVGLHLVVIGANLRSRTMTLYWSMMA